MKKFRIAETLKYAEINALPLEVKEALNIDGVLFKALEQEKIEEPLFSSMMNELLAGRICDLEKILEIEYERVEKYDETEIKQIHLYDQLSWLFKNNDIAVYSSVDGKGTHYGRIKGLSRDACGGIIIETDIDSISMTVDLSENDKFLGKSQSIESLISQATAISEQSKSLADDLEKIKDTFDKE